MQSKCGAPPRPSSTSSEGSTRFEFHDGDSKFGEASLRGREQLQRLVGHCQNTLLLRRSHLGLIAATRVQP
ncbi:hypothetical protein M404DRAFT_1008062 [Pisolithus tinctorius Marx 270]|uniref:Uncharacterized protein n=1 Tax=Pisolithus tinctorius Marx 270 TaxID=870435 RepID=A0A0C3N0Z7_PISTI|nr:hypothetical protein M404DRAFT_1008062 [Pisolithus tinctorius Marx 270]